MRIQMWHQVAGNCGAPKIFRAFRGGGEDGLGGE